MRWLVVHPGAAWGTVDVYDGVVHGLRAHGVEVVIYHLDQRITAAQSWLHTCWRKAKKTHPDIARPTWADVLYQAASGLLERAFRYEVDRVLVVSGGLVLPDTLRLLRNANLPVGLLLTESPYDLEQERVWAALADVTWTNERTAVEALRAVCPATSYLPHAWHPKRHHPGAQPGDAAVPAHDVVFVGYGFPERVAFFEAVDWTGLDLGLYGSWDMLPKTSRLRHHVKGGVVDNATAAALYRRAKVGLNLHRTRKGWHPSQPTIDGADSLNPRCYELAACGVFFATDARAEVAERFGALVPTFATPAEATTVLRHWVAQDAARQAAAAALPGCVAGDSWEARAAQVITQFRAARRRAA